MDDTNPTKEEVEYVDSIMADVKWLIDGWADKNLGLSPGYASNYFDRLYEYATELVRKGKAYVDDMTPEQTDEFRRLGKESPFRNRAMAENLDLLARMKLANFRRVRTLRAKIDMSAPNVWLRDPVLSNSSRRASSDGGKWCIYPMCDFAHTLSDYIEGITHSVCTLEFETPSALRMATQCARPSPTRPHQYEFARLNRPTR